MRNIGIYENFKKYMTFTTWWSTELCITTYLHLNISDTIYVTKPILTFEPVDKTIFRSYLCYTKCTDPNKFSFNLISHSVFRFLQ